MKNEICDLLVKNGILVDSVNGIIENGALAILGNKIIATGKTRDLQAQYQAREILDATDKIILPGLINAHTHASATLFRGYAADVAGKEFLRRMWRIEAQLTEDDVYIGALAGCMEMIKSGITGFANHFLHMDKVARAVKETGMRAVLSRTMLDHGDASKSNNEIKEALKFIESWSDTCARINPILGPHAAYTCSDKLLKTCAQEARKLSVMLHMHFAENHYELTVMKQRTGTTTAQHLEKMDFFRSNRIIGAHSLFLTDKDLNLLKKHDFHAVACIPGKMNRGHGIVDLTRLMDAGLNVCLGTDGSASDNLDLLAGMKITHISQNYLHKQVCSLSPETIIEMATLNGAKALKWKAGQLSPGFLADLIMIDTRKVHLRPLITKPVSNVMFNVVYYAMGFDVDTVVIDGRVIMREKELLTIDESEILNHLQQKAQALWKRAR